MIKKIFTFLVVATFISSFTFATIRRVGYFGPPVAGVDYPSFQAAHDASAAGDTIMMQPGSNFGSANMTKKLVVIGPGYFLSQNTSLQANTLGMDSAAGTLDITNATANGSSFIGCTFAPGTQISGTGIQNISFLRCWINGSNFQKPGINLLANVNNFLFQQCVFAGNGLIAANGGSTVVCTNMSFVNCLFYRLDFSAQADGLYFNDLPNSGLVQNCIFEHYDNFTLPGSWAVNNTISYGKAIGSGITFQNCIGDYTQFPAGNGNLQYQRWDDIFTLIGSTDGQYTLKTGSPAIGAGIGGTNCGIFGGVTPYRLSGIPGVPTIYALTSPQGGTPTVNTIQINLSTRSNN